MQKYSYILKCRNFIKEKYKMIYYRFYYKKLKKDINIKMFSIEETIEVITKEKVSVSRFGDGEFKWLLEKKQNSFQRNSKELVERLKEIITSEKKGHIVCITPAVSGLEYLSKRGKIYWEVTLGELWPYLEKYLDKKRKYYNANITRFYISELNRDKAFSRFELLKQIWEKREILIVEGEYTRLGIGNDLFSNSKKIRRIIAPSKNAFSKYKEILESVKKNYKEEELVLIALGPTATVLAYDLSQSNIQAIDIGHIDIEYEWYLRGATSKIPIPGKFVNEAIIDLSREKLTEDILNKYLSEIVEKIEI